MKKLFFLMLCFSVDSLSYQSKVETFFNVKWPVIAVIDIGPSPGKKGFPGIENIIKKALPQMRILERAGVDGVLFENDDSPSDIQAPKETIAMMSVVIHRLIKEAKTIKVGAEFILHDPEASLAIAKASGAQFIRTDFFVDRMKNRKGEMKIDPKGYLAYRSKIKGNNILFFTDVQVKYAKMLNPKKTLKDSTLEALNMHSDGLVVTGRRNGHPPSVEKLKEVFEAQKKSGVGVIQGSGFSYKNAAQLLPYSNGVIVGTSIMDKNRNIIEEKAIQLMETVRKLRAQHKE